VECNKVEILAVKAVSQHYYLLTLMAPRLARSVRPGQFVQVRVADGLDPLLRRPFSVHDWDAKQGTVALLVQVRGKGSKMLADKRPGERLDVLGPLGRGFEISETKGRALLVGGGIGAAPLWSLARQLKDKTWDLTVLLGASADSLLVKAVDFSHLANTIIATDDGSAGIKGKITKLLPLAASDYNQVYACGPKPMLAALAVWTKAAGFPLQVSLDEVMACGMGVCLGCAQPVKHNKSVNYAKVCTQGPVFDADEVVWNE